MTRVFVSAAHKSSGKTTVSIGLCASLTKRGYRVAPFKKGPDYIDPLWLSKACTRSCYNLDFNTQSHDEIDNLWLDKAANADLAFVEGNKGLYDGMNPDGSDCNAALAKQLNTPVILVVDCQGITRGVAPLIQGYTGFDANLDFAGVILNKVAGSRHEGKLRQAVEQYTDLPVLGAVGRSDELIIDERHLGLVPSNEHELASNKIETIREHIDRSVDMERLIDILGISASTHTESTQTQTAKGLRIGIAQDGAFGFYYQDDLDRFRVAGIELVEIDLIHDDQLPPIHGLIIGGGFPETHMQALSENTAMMTQIAASIENGLPVFAECGGLMYLCRGIEWNGGHCKMVGALPADVVMHKRPQGRGYVRIKQRDDALWSVVDSGTEMAAHEFHHSSLKNIGEEVRYAYDVIRGKGISEQRDGMTYRNVLASYTHLRSTAQSPWVEKFIAYVEANRSK